MLYSERKRQADIAKRQESGEDIWIKIAPPELRTKFQWLLESFGWVANSYDTNHGYKELAGLAKAIVERSTGRQRWINLETLIHSGSADEFIDAIEASYHAVKITVKKSGLIKNKEEVLDDFRSQVNSLFESYRMAYSFDNNEIIPFENKAIHKEIVAPALKLLSDPKWAGAEKSYHDALKSVTDGRLPDAITDATTALQEGLRTAGCKGGSLKDLVKSAKNTILKGYDTKYIDAIEKLIDWSSATRSEKGDSHKTSNPEKADVWLTIHLVGTLLLYISKKFPGN